MNRKVKRYDPINSDGTCGMCIEDADYGAYVEYEDFTALEAECDSLWSTYVALVDKLGIDTEKAKTADGKPSDVIVSYVDALRGEVERLTGELGTVKKVAYGNLDLLEENKQLRAQLARQQVPEGWRDAFMKMRNVAAGYSNYCEESASTRRLDREFESADELFCSISALAAPAPVQHPDDAAVDRFAKVMKAKLAKSRAKGRAGKIMGVGECCIGYKPISLDEVVERLKNKPNLEHH